MTEREQTVVSVLARISGRPEAEVTAEKDLAGDLGIDSPKALHLLMELESKLQIDISDEDAARLSTVGDVLDFVNARKA